MGLLKTAGMAIVNMLLAGATQEFFQDIALLVLEKGAKSTKTDWDDKVVESFRQSVEKKED